VSSWALPAGSGEGWADDYERGRPGWPAEVADIPGLAPEATVLDLCAGTGKLTRLLAGVFARVVAVEPAGAMRRQLERIVPAAEALSGTAQEIPLADASVDAVFVAQALHRFAGERAVAEIARVLRRSGALVLLWNVPAGEWEPSAEAAEAVLRERMPPVDYVALDLGGPGDSLDVFAGSPFESLEETRFPNPQTLDREGLVAFYASMGWVGDLPDEERLPLLEEVRCRLDADEYTRAWGTHAYWTRRSGMR
jgi:ubiquinone/menaquinone biosynthesis C-methylase UbiE